MKENKQVIEHESYKVVLSRADVLMGARHTILVSRGIAEGEGEELALRLIRLYTYPACIGATVEHEGFEEWPPPLEDFCELPEVFVSAWERKAYELNTHWMPDTTGTEEEEEEKNAQSESDSSPSTEGS